MCQPETLSSSHVSCRLPYLDFLKGVLILLVISFHLVYFEHLYPYAKQVVYTFHMPAFLLISGFLVNINKPVKAFLRSMLWIAIPYTIMESGYIVAASMLPVSDHVDNLSVSVFLDKLFLHPLGPYWYLHTILVCGLLSRFAMLLRCRMAVRVAVLAIAYWLISQSPLSLTFSCALYYLAGFALRRGGCSFTSVFAPSPLFLFGFALFASTPSALDKPTIDILMVYFSVSSLLWIYKVAGDRLRKWLSYLGRKSLLLYVFSPVFTLASKVMVPWLSFDPTGIIFLALALALCVAGSLAVGYILDLLRLSPYIFGRNIMK